MVKLRLGIDIGGTFTDFALVDDAFGKLSVNKCLTTPDNPSEAIMKGLKALLERESLQPSHKARVSPKNEMVLTPGTAVTIHPTVFTTDGRNWSFCGETYLVTVNGYERLHRAGDVLITV
jgi:N-methylhydantoinase A/oxoprolinase/acetone carboxylase beta subunit